MVHDYAANNLDSDSSLAAHVRHARYLVRLLAELNSQYLQGGENVVSALARFDAIWPLVRSEFVACQHSANEEAVRLVSETPDAAPQLFDLRRHPRERIEWRQAALAAARQLGDRRREGNHLGNLGLAYSGLGEPRRAIEYLEQRIAIAREIGDRRSEGRGHGNLGLAFAILGQTQRAVDCQEQYLHIAREIRAAQLTATGLEEAVERMSRLGVCNPKRMSTALIPG